MWVSPTVCSSVGGILGSKALVGERTVTVVFHPCKLSVSAVARSSLRYQQIQIKRDGPVDVSTSWRVSPTRRFSAFPISLDARLDLSRSSEVIWRDWGMTWRSRASRLGEFDKLRGVEVFVDTA